MEPQRGCYLNANEQSVLILLQGLFHFVQSFNVVAVLLLFPFYTKKIVFFYVKQSIICRSQIHVALEPEGGISYSSELGSGQGSVVVRNGTAASSDSAD